MTTGVDVTPHAGSALPAAQVAADQVTSLVQMAIERNVDVEVLERLVALQERVTERNARGAYFEALAGFQENCPEIRKTRKAKIATRSGGQFEYTFAPLEEITRAIRPVLRLYGLSYSWNVEQAQGGLNVVCILRHIEGHEERAMFPVPTKTDAAMSDAQKNGAALTYGRRQSLIAVLGLTTADDDTDAAGGDRGGNNGGTGDDDADRLSRKQLADLESLIEEVKADRKKFLRWMRVQKLEDIRPEEYERAVAALEEKRRSR